MPWLILLPLAAICAALALADAVAAVWDAATRPLHSPRAFDRIWSGNAVNNRSPRSAQRGNR